KCLQQPAEPPDGGFKDKIKHTAYPVQKLGGLLFGYLGPEPAPLLPRWDVLAWENGRRWIEVQEPLRCNWLQPMKNSVDPSHLYCPQGETAHLLPNVGYEEEDHEFVPFEPGIHKRRSPPGKNPGAPPAIDQHPLLFPNTLRHVFRAKDKMLRHNLQIRMPVNDTRTQVFVVYFEPNDKDRSPADADAPWSYFAIRDERGNYRLEHVLVQDAMAWETQGDIADRSEERLGVGDEGIIAFRKIVREQIEAVRQGRDPLGVVRSADKNGVMEFD